MNNENKIVQAEAQIKALPIVEEVLSKLEKELSPALKYHSVHHTLDVLHDSIVFGVEDNLDERPLLLLGIAAAFHDAGFLQAPNPNEAIGAAMAKTAMQRKGSYTDEEVDFVAQMIMDTDMRHRGAVQTPLSGYLVDADVSNFGREDFFEKSAQFLAETGRTDGLAFTRSLLRMLERHKWQTQAAARLRQPQKEKNIAQLKSKLLK